jgi:hypothetical protein
MSLPSRKKLKTISKLVSQKKFLFQKIIKKDLQNYKTNLESLTSSLTESFIKTLEGVIRYKIMAFSAT